MNSRREHFGSRAAVIMAMAGSAIGLGNIWRFPYIVGEYGGICPGIMIFILNNISTHVSMSIGGVSFTHTENFKDGVLSGSRDYTKAHFAPDVSDISMGLTVYF